MSTQTVKHANPQYATCTDPEVIAAVLARADEIRRFGMAGVEFSRKYGDHPDGVFFGGKDFDGAYFVSAIKSSTKPTIGRWKQHGDGWAPYRGTPIHAEMEALRVELPAVPGMPIQINGPHLPSGAQKLLYPTVFVQDGAAWLGFSDQPVDEQFGFGAPVGPQWVPVRPSQYMAAHEEHTGQVTP